MSPSQMLFKNNGQAGHTITVTGKMENTPVSFIVDTGATDTIVSERVFDSIPSEVRPDLYPVKDTGEQADGSPLAIIGWTTLKISIGPVAVSMPVTVAKIKNDVLLGMDFLSSTNCVIDATNRQLKFGEQIIQGYTEESRIFCARVTISGRYTIPPGHEMVIPGKISKLPEIQGFGILEAGDSKLKDSGGIVARTVVDLDQVNPNRIPIRVFNPTMNKLTVTKKTTVGTVSPIVACEIVNKMSDVDEDITEEVEIPEHLVDLFEASIKELPVEQHAKVARLLMEYQDVFSTGDGDLGRTGVVKHRIETRNAPPNRQKARRMPPILQAETDRQIKDMLDRGIIEPSKSPWASPIVLVTKKDGSKRFCADYRMLNDLTVKDSYPIPRIEESLDSLAGAKWFSTLDLASGYWQVELDEAAKEKSAFVVRSGLYQWTVMPFGLCNAPATFERLMENIMRGLQWESLLVYLDDLIVFGKTIDEEIERLRVVFQRLRQANLKLKPKKCVLFQRKVLYLGHIVTAEGIATDPEKIRVIEEWGTPTSVHDVRSFLGLASYYRRFVKGFCDIARPLYNLTKKKVAFKWTEQSECAFKELKKCLITSPILAYPTPSGEFVLDTDASAFGIGAVLSQIQGGQEHVIAYASRTLSKQEKNYCVTRRELLAVVYYVRYFRPYLYGRHFTIRTDHGSLRWLLNFRDPEGQIARWIQVLGEYDYTVVHRPGKSHQNADSLSRRPCPQCKMDIDSSDSEKAVSPSALKRKNGTTKTKKSVHWKPEPELAEIRYFDYDPLERINVSRRKYHVGLRYKKKEQLCSEKQSNEADWHKSTGMKSVDLKSLDAPRLDSRRQVKARTVSASVGWTSEEMKEAQRDDSDLQLIIEAKENNQRPTLHEISSRSKAAKVYYLEWKRLELREGILYRRWESDDGRVIRWQLIVPKKYQNAVLKELHSAKTAAHFGIYKTRGKINERFYWYGVSHDIRSWIRRCDTCAKRKSPSTRRRAKLQQDIMGHFGQRIAMDILGPLPTSDSGNRHILVVGDYFTKWIDAYPIPDQEAVTCAKKFTEEWVSRHGCPQTLHSDQGRNFESHVFAEMCDLLGIEKTRTTPLNPKSDGLIERFNRTMLDTVSVLLDEHKHQRDWDAVLPYALMAYRSAVQESTQETPHAMLYGEEMVLPIDLATAPGNDQDKKLNTDYVQDLRSTLRATHDRAREKLQLAARRQKRNYDKACIKDPIEEGSFVWLHNETRKKGQCPKLQYKWEGPYLVIKKLSDVVFRIQKSQQSKPKVVHYDRLKPYVGEPLHSWIKNKC